MGAASNVPGLTGTTAYVAKQATVCFVGLAAVVPEAPLTGGLLVAGGIVAAVAIRCRRRGRAID